MKDKTVNLSYRSLIYIKYVLVFGAPFLLLMTGVFILVWRKKKEKDDFLPELIKVYYAFLKKGPCQNICKCYNIYRYKFKRDVLGRLSYEENNTGGSGPRDSFAVVRFSIRQYKY